MSRSGLQALVAEVVIGVGDYTCQQSQRPALEVTIGGNGLKVSGKGG